MEKQAKGKVVDDKGKRQVQYTVPDFFRRQRIRKPNVTLAIFVRSVTRCSTPLLKKVVGREIQ